MSMQEYVDVMDESGRYTGERVLKDEAHRKGLFHPTVHVWLYTTDGRVLLQKRGANKASFPLLWDVSVAGHVAAGEDILDAAIRETEEEIGLKIEAEQLQELGRFKSIQQHREDFVDKEYHYTYLCELAVPFSTLQKQHSEVEALQLIPLITLAEEVWGLANPSKYVPHDKEYYKAIIEGIKSNL